MTDPSGSTYDLTKKISEAEAYFSHDLLNEAIEVYEDILSHANALDMDAQQDIESRIESIRATLDDREKFDQQTLTSQDVSVIKETWSNKEESPSEILVSASAFKELGLYIEAIEQYFKLFLHDHPPADVISKLSECINDTPTPKLAIEQLNDSLRKSGLDAEKSSEIKSKLADMIERLGKKDFVQSLYTSAKETRDKKPVQKRRLPKDGLKIDTGFEAEQKRASRDVTGLKLEKDVAPEEDPAGLLDDGKVYASRYQYLLEKEFVTKEQLQNSLVKSKSMSKSVEQVLIDLNNVDKDEIGKSLSLFYKCKFKTFSENMPIPFELLGKLKKAFLLQNCWVPINWNIAEGVVEVLIDDPMNLMKTDAISALIQAKKIKYCVGIHEDIQKVIKHFYSEDAQASYQASSVSADAGLDMVMSDIDFEDEEDETESLAEASEGDSQIVRLVDQVLITAYRKGASDIHIEPSVVWKRVGIRFRIDGVCQNILQLPLSNARAIISRLKIMSGLDIAERRMPQDGKIKFKKKGIRPFELRLATLPTAGAFEDAVLRILAESGAMKLDEMGLTERNFEVMNRIVTQPYGLLLVVGPTGSGKTTTLHSALGHINKPGVKIWTAEDPVEITQAGLRQVECNPKIGLDFARVMRAFLRADPDIIMIGEMRDHETASIGIEASLTGHLVFSTLHTNSAPETITRLLDMGLNPLNFSDAFLGVLAQRLIRRVCKKCREQYHPSPEAFQDICELFGGEEKLAEQGVEYTEDITLYRHKGCDECNQTGYRGRMGIHEMMDGTPEVKKMIKRSAATDEMFRQAASDGMLTLIQDGILKVFQGHSDIEEVRRVVVS